MKQELNERVSQIKDTNIRDNYIEGIAQIAGITNNNNRIYPKEILERERKKLMSQIYENGLAGCLDHGNSANSDLDRISHKITDLYWNESETNYLMIKCKLLDTPTGKIALELAKEGLLYISSRGLGTVNEENNTVNQDYRLLTFDLVANPGVSQAHMEIIKESLNLDIKKEIKKNIETAQSINDLVYSKLVEYSKTFNEMKESDSPWNR